MSLSLYQLLRVDSSVIRACRLAKIAQLRKSGDRFRILHAVPSPAFQQSCRVSTGHKHTERSVACLASSDNAAEPSTSAFGQVMSAQANFVRIKVDRLDGSDAPPPKDRLLCVVRALLKKIKQQVLVGDYVKIVGIDWTDGRGMVEEVMPRSSQLAEPRVANISHVVLVFSLDLPPFQPSSATRYLLSAEAAGLPVTVALNKSDLLTAEQVQAEVQRLSGWGYTAIPTSVQSGEGMEEIQKRLNGEVAVLAGPSGAGKSSIINALSLKSVGLESTLQMMEAVPSEYNNASNCIDAESSCDGSDQEEEEGLDQSTNSKGTIDVDLQAVGSVSGRLGRGKHTTRNVTLIEMRGGGLLADTPGFNQPDLNIPSKELAEHFPEIQERLEQGSCAFQNCQHLSEPGCIVRGDWERYSFYTALHAELKEVEEANAQRATSKRQREGRTRVKSRAGGQVGIEARLDTKSHRRVSRKAGKQVLMDIVRDAESEDELT